MITRADKKTIVTFLGNPTKELAAKVAVILNHRAADTAIAEMCAGHTDTAIELVKDVCRIRGVRF